jgi:opacity protein-like surface antigen
MKQFFLLFALCLFAYNSANAQGFEAKRSFLSGGVAFAPGVGGFGQYEYGLNEHWGLGASFAAVGGSSYYGVAVGVTTFAARTAYHFNTENKFDPYLTAGLGVVSATGSYGGYTSSSASFAFMGGVGARYYFTEKIAANAEVVYNEPWIKLGLSLKL